MRRSAIRAVVIGCLLTIDVSRANAQDQQPSNGAAANDSAASVALPPGYVIGTDDVLSILFWNEKEMSAEVTVRPDGKVSLPLLNDVHAAGLTPANLREVILDAARKYVADPNPTVIVKTINSRKVFITGQVEKPGPYPLNSSTTVLQLLAMAGGVKEFARSKNITVLRTEGSQQLVFRFNYQDVQFGKNLQQNIELRPGDTVVVP
jgi:polysaccharide export outer membrane protein